MLGQLQEGIHWQAGSKPRSYYKLIILKPSIDLSTSRLYFHLRQIWLLCQSLKNGVIPSLGANYPVDPESLQVLIGYGHKFFERSDLAQPTPEGMAQINRFPQPNETSERSILPGSGIVYDPDVKYNDADEEIALQLLADSPLAVHRVQVEINKYLQAMREESIPDYLQLTIAKAFDGFGRRDKRNWIDFHDGISNLRKGEERRQVVAIKPDNAGGQDWTLNGSYMVFMRLQVNLEIWQQIPQNDQEILVGRTKQSGCPLTGVDSMGTALPDPRCPVNGSKEVIEPRNEQFREPSSVVPDLIKISHVQRANHHRAPVFKPDSRRIYRQGFEFLEEEEISDVTKIGLNFVSFQDDPDRTLFILTHPDWLGNLSFGGDPNSQGNGLDRLVTARAAGTFFVPPVHGNSPFPGAEMFSI